MKLFWIILQFTVGIGLWFPIVLLLASFLRRKIRKAEKMHISYNADFGIIVTAYQQVDLIESVVHSILNSTHTHFIIYVVLDACDVFDIEFNDKRVVIFKPDEILGSNIKSHFYAINRFKRKHDVITIIDSDNLVTQTYLAELNNMFKKGYKAMQGIRKARNLNTVYACLDEGGDIFYRFIDRKLLYEAGSSASLAGSGMAFTTDIYKECLAKFNLSGAGFDKVLQYELVKRGEVIAFAENAIVYDGKTSKSDQLVKQRARWINTWFRYWVLGMKLFIRSVSKPNWNQFAFSMMLLRPPLFILFFVMIIMIMLNFFIAPWCFFIWLAAMMAFFLIFLTALHYFNAGSKIYKALLHAPQFIFYQVIALFKARSANKISVATKHDATLYNEKVNT